MREPIKETVQKAYRPWYHMSRIARIVFLVYGLLLLLFALLAYWVYQTPVSSIDVAITHEFQEKSTPWISILMQIISYPGSTLLLACLVVFTTILCWFVGLQLEALMIIGLSLCSTLINHGLKLLINRPRPRAPLVEVIHQATGNSFPSGHVMAYIAFWGLLFSLGIIAFRGRYWWRILLLVISAIFVILVGPSRIYLGNHWASDVLGSYLIGIVLLGTTLWLYLRLKQHGVLSTKQPTWVRSFHNQQTPRPKK